MVKRKEIELKTYHSQNGSKTVSNEGWTRYFDAENQAYYWYNSLTGESTWDDDQTNYDYYQEELDDTGEKQGLLQSPSLPAAEDTALESDDEPVHGDALNFWRFLYVNAILVEAPLCIIEAMLRIFLLSIVFLLIAIYCWIRFRSFQQETPRLRLILRDIGLTAIAALVLFVPGMILYIYRNFHPYKDWNLCLLPTCIGPIDCRRFLLLTLFGSASLAKNVYDPAFSFTSSHGPTEVWPDSIFCFPREILSWCILLQRRRRSSRDREEQEQEEEREADGDSSSLDSRE